MSAHRLNWDIEIVEELFEWVAKTKAMWFNQEITQTKKARASMPFAMGLI
jgi:hypothetical protein